MQIKIKLELQDYRKWNMAYFYSGLRGKLIVSVSAVVILAMTYYVWFVSKSNVQLSPQIIFVAALGLLFMFLMPVSIYYQSKKVFESDKFLQDEQAYDFREDGFSVKAPYGCSEVTWDKVYRITTTREFISIYLSKIRAFVVPSRLLPAQEYEILKKILNEKNVNVR
jgi:hypothetical protein